MALQSWTIIAVLFSVPLFYRFMIKKYGEPLLVLGSKIFAHKNSGIRHRFARKHAQFIWTENWFSLWQVENMVTVWRIFKGQCSQTYINPPRCTITYTYSNFNLFNLVEPKMKLILSITLDLTRQRCIFTDKCWECHGQRSWTAKRI